MRSRPLLTSLVLPTLLSGACASFGASEDPAPGPPVGTTDGGDGSIDASPNADADAATPARARTLYVFGGVTVVNETEQPVFEAFAASILDDGSLGAWERAPMLDIGRSYMTTIAGSEGPVILAGGNGMALGEGASNDFRFFRDDVSVAGGAPHAWSAAPPLGASNGRWAAAGTIMSRVAYVGGGILAGNSPTNTILAATVTIAPPTTQGWQLAGALPFAVADHGLVALGSRLYVFGGATAREGGVDLSSEAFMTTVAGAGMVSAWTPTARLPKPLKAFGVVGAEDRVFVIGGEDATDVSASVFIGLQTQTQELVWQETSPLKHARHHPCVVRANGHIYAIGGSKVSSVVQVVEVGDVNGTSLTWRETTAMPVTRSALGCAAR